MKQLLFLFFSILSVTGCAAAGGRGAEGGRYFPAAPDIISFYQGPLDHLNAVRSGRCPMQPSCSEYAKEAMARHGFLTGWTMSLDRLMRCGRDEKRVSPLVWVDGRWKIYDPLDANDFWWRGPDN